MRPDPILGSLFNLFNDVVNDSFKSGADFSGIECINWIDRRDSSPLCRKFCVEAGWAIAHSQNI